MYKIKYEYIAKEKLNDFILSFKEVYKKLYFDSGLFDLDIITESYIRKGDDLEQDIIIKIKEILQEEIVAHKFQNNQKSIKIFIKSFMLEIFYEEDEEEKIRFIENIIINKK